MTMTVSRRARALAGAFLLLALTGAARGERLRVAAERPDGTCPPDAKPPGVVRLEAPWPEGAPAACLFLVRLEGLSDADIDTAVERLATVHGATGVVIALPAADDAERFSYAVKRLSSIFRSGSPDGQFALDATPPAGVSLEEDLAAYVDALVAH